MILNLSKKSKTVLFLSGTAIMAQIFIMLAIPSNHNAIFVLRNSIEPIEWVIVALILYIFLFFVSSIAWLLTDKLNDKQTFPQKMHLYLGIILYFLSTIIEKVMLDEIGREYLLGWEVIGEWIILYVAFFVQLIYILAFTRYILKLYRLRLAT